MTIEIRGLDGVRRELEKVRKGILETEKKAMEAGMGTMLRGVPAYPEKPEGSRYRRTGTLGRRIGTRVNVVGNEVVGAIGTNTVYAPWVISEEAVGERGPQARVHRGRWWTLQGVVRENAEEVVRVTREWLERLFR